jgi:hypothetical protein
LNRRWIIVVIRPGHHETSPRLHGDGGSEGNTQRVRIDWKIPRSGSAIPAKSAARNADIVGVRGGPDDHEFSVGGQGHVGKWPGIGGHLVDLELGADRDRLTATRLRRQDGEQQPA